LFLRIASLRNQRIYLGKEAAGLTIGWLKPYRATKLIKEFRGKGEPSYWVWRKELAQFCAQFGMALGANVDISMPVLKKSKRIRIGCESRDLITWIHN